MREGALLVITWPRSVDRNVWMYFLVGIIFVAEVFNGNKKRIFDPLNEQLILRGLTFLKGENNWY